MADRAARGAGSGTGRLFVAAAAGVSANLARAGQLRVTVLDVGQGLAVLLQTARHNLLFDTGPGEAGRIVLPQLAGLGVERLDTVLLSHHDNDHDGAAASLLAGIKVGRILAGQPQSLAEMGLRGSACLRGQSWVWDGVRFDVLSPGAQEMAADDNSHSCVLRVATRQQAIMLSGDAPQAVESELVRRYGPALGSTVLVAGHHGSKTSSADDWLAALHPAWLVVSAGYLNRYHHPHPSVLARVQQAAISVLRTDLDGAITLQLGATTVPSCYRTAARRYWRAEGDCGAPPAAGRGL
ncbi:ComEC/Rec2 family competence protein [Paludibacterium denitrificans]|uniref:ComEC/Rec2 family competence protein n=1 Tax=Paludibacterium denitrificans TaxID=2675226 RepID=UPI001E64BB0F|nr:ComEC/Rec2 family competence protein [Paludibacterium denitrificans]